MRVSLVAASWHRAERHRWITVTRRPYLTPSGSRLTNSRPPGWVVHHGITFAPLADEPALFRTFASTEPTRDGMRSFADRFGLLGTGERTTIKGSQGRPLEVEAESERRWRREIHAMRLAVALWDASRTDNQAQLREMVEWNDGLSPSSADAIKAELMRDGGLTAAAAARAVASHRTPTVVLLRDPTMRPCGKEDAFAGRIGSARPGDYGLESDGRLGTAGWCALLWLLSDRLASPNIVVGLTWDHGSPDSWTASRLTTRREPGAVLQLRAPSLLNAMWWQFAQAVDGGREYRRCAYRKCREWFEISAASGGRRRTAEYCAEPRRCRLNECRERQREKTRATQTKGTR